MTRASMATSEGYMRPISFMDEVQAFTKNAPEFNVVSTEAYQKKTSGEDWRRGAKCETKWTLAGACGLIRIEASQVNDFQCPLLTTISVKSDYLGAQELKVGFGGETQAPSELCHIGPVIKTFLGLISKPPLDPFATASLPKHP